MGGGVLQACDPAVVGMNWGLAWGKKQPLNKKINGPHGAGL